MFEAWKEGELAAIKERYGKVRLMTLGLMALVGFNLLGSVVMLLDGGGVMQVVVILFQGAIMALIWTMGDYKRRFVKPLLATVEEALPTQGEREEFARQMGEAPECSYAPAPQIKVCPLWVGKDYSYFRQPGKSRILKNRDIRRAKLAEDTYTVGRGHLRTCYDLVLYGEEEKEVWRASFPSEGAAYQMWEVWKPNLSPNIAVEDEVAFSKTEEGRQKSRKEALSKALMAFAMAAVLVVIAKLLQ